MAMLFLRTTRHLVVFSHRARAKGQARLRAKEPGSFHNGRSRCSATACPVTLGDDTGTDGNARKANQFDPDRARLSTWLFGIAHHAGLKALARSAEEACTALPIGEERDYEEPESTNDPATTILGWELGRELMAALQQLSSEHRAVVELTFVEGFSYPQIASIVGCPENTVKTRMFHARRRLAQLLSPLELESARAYPS